MKQFQLQIDLNNSNLSTLLHVSEAFGESCRHLNHAEPLEIGNCRTVFDEKGSRVGWWRVIEVKGGRRK